MTREQLEKELQALKDQETQAIAVLQQIRGGIFVTEHYLAEWDKPAAPEPPTVTPTPESKADEP